MIETEDPQEKIRHNIEAYKAAIAAGTHSQQDLDDYLSEVHEQRTGKPFVNPAPDNTETTGDRAAGALSAAYQGLTLGQGDKVIAALQTLGKASTGQIPSFSAAREDFGKNRADQQQVINQYRERRPGAAAVMEAAGSIPTFEAAGGLLKKAIGRAAEAIPSGAISKTVREIPGVPKVQRIAKAWTPQAAKAIEAPSPVVGHIAPRIEGLTGSAMDDVLEAVKAQRAGGDAQAVVSALRREQPMYDAFSSEARTSDAASPMLPDVVKATERYRTESGALQQRAPNARFDWFAERMAKRKQP